MVLTPTYETIYDIVRREKIHPELQKVDKFLLQGIKDYLKEKQQLLTNNQQSIFSQKESELTLKQIENTKRLVKELYERREAKVLALALSASKTKSKYDTSSLLQEEISLYESLKTILSSSRQNLLAPIISEPLTLNPQGKLKQVKFLNPTPQFLGTDERAYGPFEQDYIAIIPEDIALVLIKNKRAEEI